VSRAWASKVPPEPHDVDLFALVREVADQKGDVLTRAGCELRLTASSPIVGTWDPLRLEPVVTNLLSNAAKSGQGRPIEVEVGLARPGRRASSCGTTASGSPPRMSRGSSNGSHAG
jgi:signal transduction histidine kinase